uniref:Sj-Ts2 protein n=1 Tax=Schistosoma japonicum TaxID=6182 RepID=Q9GSV8_SCHJA|nr:Sj-Ts2 protein [Schistosoma japonicum]
MNTVIYVEPNTGSIIKAQKKIQINILVKNDTTFKQLANISTTILPIVFINESVQLNDTFIEQLTNALIQQPFIVQTILVCIITLSIISLGSLISIHFYQNRQHTTYIQFIDSHQSNDVIPQNSLEVNTQQQTISNDLQENPIV